MLKKKKKGKRNPWLCIIPFHNFILLLFLNSLLIPSSFTKMTPLQTFCTGVVSEASLKQVSIRFRDVNQCLLPRLRPLKSQSQTSLGSSYVSEYLSVSQLRFLLVHVALCFHFHSTLPLWSATLAKKLHFVRLSVVMGSSFVVVKQMTA